MQMNCQIYVKNSVEAVAFYQNAFGWTLGMNVKGSGGSYAHASLMSGKNEALAVAEDGGVSNRMTPQAGKWPVMSFNYSGLSSRESVDRAYAILSEGVLATNNPEGPTSVPWNEYCFSLVDKFGVYWWVAI
ncbi:MAG: hypothetical protein FWE80_00865 [Oscillospiraceae bacterium]|nr:hypothetical protein [Oscillospiraceae bacterium]